MPALAARAFRSIATQVYGVVWAQFSFLWLIFSVFLGILSHLVFSQRFFLILDRFFEVLGGVWEGFWEEFSVIFGDFFEKRETVWRATKHCVGA